MKKLKDHLKLISKSLSALSKKIDQASTRIEKLQTPKTKPAKKAGQKKKAAVKNPAAKKKAPAKPSTVLDSVLNVVKKSKKGATIAALKEKTGYNSKQISNALFKLSKKDMITAKSRGVYVIK